MLSDKQSLIGSGIVLMSFVIFGILGILDNIFIAAIHVLGFIVIVVNLILTKRVPEAEELEQIKKVEENSTEEI